MGLKIPLANPIIDEETIQAVSDALRNDKFLLGENVVKFEEEFAKYTFRFCKNFLNHAG